MPTLNESKRFQGFPAGGLRMTAVPNLFLSALLPKIDSLAELKLTLHIFRLLQEKKGYPRFVTLGELIADSPFLGLAKGERPLEDVVREAVQKAVERGTLLHLSVRFADRTEDVYFVNSAQGRRAVELLRQGEIDIGQELVERPSLRAEALKAEGHQAAPERKSIFTLYEQNVGLLTPLIVEQLQEAEKLYPPQWIEEAFQQAVEYNKRNWRYIQRILERWAFEGKSNRRKSR